MSDSEERRKEMKDAFEELRALEEALEKIAFAESKAKYWKDLYKSLQHQPHRADLFTRYRYRQEGIRTAQEVISQNIRNRIEDLRSCDKDDSCAEFASLLEEYLPEWMETGHEND